MIFNSKLKNEELPTSKGTVRINLMLNNDAAFLFSYFKNHSLCKAFVKGLEDTTPIFKTSPYTHGSVHCCLCASDGEIFSLRYSSFCKRKDDDLLLGLASDHVERLADKKDIVKIIYVYKNMRVILKARNFLKAIASLKEKGYSFQELETKNFRSAAISLNEILEKFPDVVEDIAFLNRETGIFSSKNITKRVLRRTKDVLNFENSVLGNTRNNKKCFVEINFEKGTVKLLDKTIQEITEEYKEVTYSKIACATERIFEFVKTGKPKRGTLHISNNVLIIRNILGLNEILKGLAGNGVSLTVFENDWLVDSYLESGGKKPAILNFPEPFVKEKKVKKIVKVEKVHYYGICVSSGEIIKIKKTPSEAIKHFECSEDTFWGRITKLEKRIAGVLSSKESPRTKTTAFWCKDRKEFILIVKPVFSEKELQEYLRIEKENNRIKFPPCNDGKEQLCA